MYESNYFSTRQNTVICSIDLKKAYDNVNHDLLFKKLEKLNIPKYLINLIKDIYKNTTMQVKIAGETSSGYSYRGVCLDKVVLAFQCHLIYLLVIYLMA